MASGKLGGAARIPWGQPSEQSGCAQREGGLVYSKPIDLGSIKLKPVNVSVSTVTLAGKSVVRVTKDPKLEAVDEATFAKLVGSEFKDGVIEVNGAQPVAFGCTGSRVGIYRCGFSHRCDQLTI